MKRVFVLLTVFLLIAITAQAQEPLPITDPRMMSLIGFDKEKAFELAKEGMEALPEIERADFRFNDMHASFSIVLMLNRALEDERMIELSRMAVCKLNDEMAYLHAENTVLGSTEPKLSLSTTEDIGGLYIDHFVSVAVGLSGKQVADYIWEAGTNEMQTGEAWRTGH